LINDISDRDYWKELAVFSPEKIRRMLDAEYISELAIAYLNGPQNKKDKLDYYYTMYESEFDDADELSTLFNQVCGEIVQLLPDIKKTRWNNMVDFYTLFLVLSQYREKIPFASDIREKLSDILVDFSTNVMAIQKGREDISATDNQKKYAAGVRNSSDLGSRKQRFSSLDAEISALFVQNTNNTYE